ncbi:hypothetical protein [Cystobacter fuscus]|uniref:hypothetical protein n=1 Tax=Cystobacter fuscus TaxID=43 RepID=UPI002B3150E8|nr:hypothetical protein F0U63_23830 [Cystobacter fuscus]
MNPIPPEGVAPESYSDPNDEVLLEGKFFMDPLEFSRNGLWIISLLLMGMLVLALAQMTDSAREFNLAAVCILGLWLTRRTVVTLLQFRASGRYQLKEERLRWVPRQGPAIEVPLSSISQDNGVELNRKIQSVCVRLKDGRTLKLIRITNAELLTVSLYVRTQMHDISGPRKHSSEASVFWAFHDSGFLLSQHGYAVIVPGRVAFLPLEQNCVESGAELFEALHVGSRSPLKSAPRADPIYIFEQLRRLPQGEFEQYLEAVVRNLRGFFWSADQVEAIDIKKYRVEDSDEREWGMVLKGSFKNRRSLHLGNTAVSRGTPLMLEAGKELLSRSSAMPSAH